MTDKGRGVLEPPAGAKGVGRAETKETLLTITAGIRKRLQCWEGRWLRLGAVKYSGLENK